jgi:hypothetical protein
MNWISQRKWPWLALALSLPVLILAGCATTGAGSRPARPGDGLREYQKLVSDLRKAVVDCVQSSEKLASAAGNKAAAAQARFNDSAQRLEVVSVSARAHADAMEKRGEAYFEEWAEEIAGSGDEAARRAAKVRFAELRQHFDGILKDSRQVRQSFRQFLDGLREARARFGSRSVPVATEKWQPTPAQIAADGRHAEVAMDHLLSTLKAAEIAVRSGPVPPAKPGGKG